jgi:hypothetical protein
MKRITEVVNDADELATALGAALIPDPKIHADLAISEMTSKRWDEDPEMHELGWPPPIRIKRRKYRVASAYQQFKKNLINKAIHNRSIITRAQKREIA